MATMGGILHQPVASGPRPSIGRRATGSGAEVNRRSILIQHLAITIITSPPTTGRSKDTAGSARGRPARSPETATGARFAVAGSPDRTGPPSRRLHPASGPTGSRRGVPSGTSLGASHKGRRPARAIRGTARVGRAAQGWRPSPEDGGRQADEVRPVWPQRRWGRGAGTASAPGVKAAPQRPNGTGRCGAVAGRRAEA